MKKLSNNSFPISLSKDEKFLSLIKDKDVYVINENEKIPKTFSIVARHGSQVYLVKKSVEVVDVKTDN